MTLLEQLNKELLSEEETDKSLGELDLIRRITPDFFNAGVIFDKYNLSIQVIFNIFVLPKLIISEKQHLALQVKMEFPQYQQIANNLRSEILSGKYNEGDLLPSENELCTSYNLARATVRQALAELVNQGYIIKKHGKGSLVRTRRDSLGLLTFKGFSDALGISLEIFTRILKGPVQTAWQKNFFYPLSDAEKSAGCVYLERLRFAGNDPVMHEFTFIPDTRIPGFCAIDFVNNSLFQTLAAKYQINIINVIQDICAVSAKPETADLLNVETGAPVIHIYREYLTNYPDFKLYSSLFCNTEKYYLGNTIKPAKR